MDYFSNFAEVDSLSKTTSRAVIKKLKAHFACHGIPDVVVSDNGPQFSSEEFHGFSRDWEFTHITSSPLTRRQMEMQKARLSKSKGC